MAREIEHYCPSCEEDRTFWRSASTLVTLGEKTKWWCDECEYGLILINGIDSSATA